MKKLFDKLIKHFGRLRYDNDDMMTYFKAEYKNDPVSAYNYWMSTNHRNYFN